MAGKKRQSGRTTRVFGRTRTHPRTWSRKQSKSAGGGAAALKPQPLSPGRRLRALLARGFVPLPGVFNAITAKFARQAGFEALYVSGSGTATGDFGLPDLGLTSLTEMVESARRVALAADLPVLADADMGFGGPVHVARTVREFEQAGVAAIHLEDQSFPKRCGHRDGKMLVSAAQMAAKIEAAVAARRDDGFMLVARCDARAVEGLEGLIARAQLYEKAGADMIFAEALPNAAEFEQVAAALQGPVLANMTEFGKSELLTTRELAAAGVAAVIWPLTAFRLMLQAAQDAYAELAAAGTQKALLSRMMSRTDMYAKIDYAEFERRIREGETL